LHSRRAIFYTYAQGSFYTRCQVLLRTDMVGKKNAAACGFLRWA
jgi:hypothetical protein